MKSIKSNESSNSSSNDIESLGNGRYLGKPNSSDTKSIMNSAFSKATSSSSNSSASSVSTVEDMVSSFYEKYKKRSASASFMKSKSASASSEVKSIAASYYASSAESSVSAMVEKSKATKSSSDTSSSSNSNTNSLSTSDNCSDSVSVAVSLSNEISSLKDNPFPTPTEKAPTSSELNKIGEKNAKSDEDKAQEKLEHDLKTKVFIHRNVYNMKYTFNTYTKELLIGGYSIPQPLSIPYIIMKQVKCIRFENGVNAPSDCSSLFAYLPNVQVIDLRGVEMPGVRKLDNMFKNDINLQVLNIKPIDTSTVNSMFNMLYGDNKLKYLTLGKHTILDKTVSSNIQFLDSVWHSLYTNRDVDIIGHGEIPNGLYIRKNFNDELSKIIGYKFIKNSNSNYLKNAHIKYISPYLKNGSLNPRLNLELNELINEVKVYRKILPNMSSLYQEYKACKQWCHENGKQMSVKSYNEWRFTPSHTASIMRINDKQINSTIALHLIKKYKLFMSTGYNILTDYQGKLLNYIDKHNLNVKNVINNLKAGVNYNSLIKSLKKQTKALKNKNKELHETNDTLKSLNDTKELDKSFLKVRNKMLRKQRKNNIITNTVGKWAIKQMPKVKELNKNAFDPKFDVKSGNLKYYMHGYSIKYSDALTNNALTILNAYYDTKQLVKNIVTDKDIESFKHNNYVKPSWSRLYVASLVINKLINNKSLMKKYNKEFQEHRYIGEHRTKAQYDDIYAQDKEAEIARMNGVYNPNNN